MKKYNILHFALGFIPVYGGNTTRISSLLADNFHDHYLYVPASPSIFIPRDMQVEPGKDDFGQIHVRRIKMFGLLQSKLPVFDYLQYFNYLKKNTRLLVKSVKEQDIDLVYGHSPLEFSLPSLLFAKENRLPFIYEAHSIKYDNLWHSSHPLFRYYHRFMQNFLIKMEKRVFRDAMFIVAQTPMIKKRIVQLYHVDKDKIKIIRNGVDTELFDSMKCVLPAKNLRVEKKWGHKFVIMYCGLLDRTNGINFLLDCLEDLPDKLKNNVKMVFIGRGELKPRIVALSKKLPFVEYVGLIRHDQIPRYIAACDLFCIPRPSSLPAETLIPMKLLEAMSMKKAVLVSDVGGMTEVVQDGNNGFVFNQKNKVDFIRKLEGIISGKKDIGGLAERAQKKILDNYTWQAARDALINVYDKAVMQGNSASFRN